MSLAYFILLDNHEPGFDPFVSEKALAHAAEVLDDLNEYKATLEQAQGVGAKWHLAVDY
jgi:hypothetical protein